MSAFQPFAVGDRVVYRDLTDPFSRRNPLAGQIIAITEHAVSVQYDAYPPTAHPGVIAVESAADVLIPEAP